MPLGEARALYWLSDKLAVLYPQNRYFQEARLKAYAGWLEACREFRNGPSALQDAPEWVKTMPGSTPSPEKA